MCAVVVVWAFFVYFVGFHHCFFSPFILFFDVTNLLRIILQETYELVDANYHNTFTSNSVENDFNKNGANVSYSEDGMSIGGNYANFMYKTPLTQPFSVKFEITKYTGNGEGYITLWKSTDVSSVSNQFVNLESKANSLTISEHGSSVTTKQIAKIGTYEIKAYSNYVEITKDNTLIGTIQDCVIDNGYLSFVGSSSSYQTIKNVVIKAL